jgi:hypothetical protein
MEESDHGIVGREGELARVKSFIGSVPEGPSACSWKERPGSAIGSGGDPLGLGQTGPVPLQRVLMGPLPDEAMTRLLRDRTGGV